MASAEAKTFFFSHHLEKLTKKQSEDLLRHIGNFMLETWRMVCKRLATPALESRVCINRFSSCLMVE